MTRLSDLARAPLRRPPRVPGWLRRLAEIGIVTDDPEVRRRQTFTNIGAYAVAGSAASHLVINGLHDFWPLLPIHAYNLIVTVLALLVHRLHRYGENAGAMFLGALVFGGHSYVIFALGVDSGLLIYFTLAGALLFLFGVQHWRLFLLFYAGAFVAMVTSFHLAPPHGLLLPADTEFRDFLYFQGLVNAFVINALLIAYALSALRRAELEAAYEHARSEALLDVILPASIAARLKAGRERRIADHIEEASVLFADIAGFTPAARAVTPEVLVDYLHRLVSEFDALCEAHGVAKIKTIGDSYMAVGGLDGDPQQGAAAAGRLALSMLEVMARHDSLGEQRVGLRIGIHSGPLVAGVIGDARIAYDVWGDAVNVAQRMEAHGAPGRIQVSEPFAELTREVFAFTPRGPVTVKGVGTLSTWFLTGEAGSATIETNAEPPQLQRG